MIETIKPDDRGRVSLLPFLKLMGWKKGNAVKIDIIEVVDLRNYDNTFNKKYTRYRDIVRIGQKTDK